MALILRMGRVADRPESPVCPFADLAFYRLVCVTDFSAPPIDLIDLFRRLGRVDWPVSPIDPRRRLVRVIDRPD